MSSKVTFWLLQVFFVNFFWSAWLGNENHNFVNYGKWYWGSNCLCPHQSQWSCIFRVKLKDAIVTWGKKVLACDVIMVCDFVVLMREFKVAICTFSNGFMLTDLVWWHRWKWLLLGENFVYFATFWHDVLVKVVGSLGPLYTIGSIWYFSMSVTL